MRKRFIWGKGIKESNIDHAVLERDAELLANLIITEDVNQETKEHLANVIFGLLTGKIKFPRGRPKKKFAEQEREQIAERVLETKKRKGWRKISSAIDEVAKELGLSKKTVWDCWSRFDVIRYEIRQENYDFDAMLDAHYEQRWEDAKGYLTEKEGARDFTDEEIEAAAQFLDDDRDHDDY